MAAIDDTAIGVAEVYAQALFELAQAAGATEEVRAEFAELVEAMRTQPAFDTYLTSEAIDADRRAATLEKLFRGKLSDRFLDTLLVLNRKGRLALVGRVHQAFVRRWEALQRQIEARVITARPLNDDQRRRVVETLAERTGRQIILHEDVDADLLGGLVVEIGDERLDGSVARQLRLLEKSLHDRAQRELSTLREAMVIET